MIRDRLHGGEGTNAGTFSKKPYPVNRRLRTEWIEGILSSGEEASNPERGNTMRILSLGLALLMVVCVPAFVEAQPVVTGGGVGGVSPLLIQAIESDILALQAAGFNDQQIFAYLLNKYGNIGVGYGGTGYGSPGYGTNGYGYGYPYQGLGQGYGGTGYGSPGYGTNGYGYGYPYRRFGLGYGRGNGGFGGRGVRRISPQQLQTVYRNFVNKHPRNRIKSPSIRQNAIGRNNRQNVGISQRHVKAQAGRNNRSRSGRTHVMAHHARPGGHRASVGHRASMSHHRASIAHRGGGHRGGGHAHRGGGHRGGGHRRR